MSSKIIRDLVYGFISINENDTKIIDHRSFQRLKNISQLTAHHLFPSANHTRFEHSLGVMYLAVKYFNALEPKMKEKGVKDEELNRIRLHLKYAALLHDVGHAPMSHVGEGFYDKKSIKSNISSILGTEIEKKYDNGSSHELMSCYVILKNFSDILKDIFELNCTEFDIDLIFRIITGSKYEGQEYWSMNVVIDIVNSDSIDVDKIDYLMRDNLMAGDVAPRINLERLLISLTIDTMNKIAYSTVGISSVVSIIDSRDFLYLWLYNHHIVVYTDFLYKEALRHLTNPKNTISPNKIDMSNLFSCKAISEYYVSDDDIRVLLNKESLNSTSIYSKRILEQLMERRFLKPIWKTIFEFNSFMFDRNNFDDRQRKEILRLFERADDREIGKIAKKLLEACSIESGEAFVIKRSNKFYAMSNKSEFFINMHDNKDVELKEIMPERKFNDNYSNVAFYVFSKAEKQDEVAKKLPDVLKKFI